jgi:hypothetical protein
MSMYLCIDVFETPQRAIAAHKYSVVFQSQVHRLFVHLYRHLCWFIVFFGCVIQIILPLSLCAPQEAFSARFYSWTPFGDAAVFGGPTPRAYHAMAAWGVYVFVHGGVGENDTILGEFFMLDVGSDFMGEGEGDDERKPVWTNLTTLNNIPGPRFRHSMAAVVKNDGIAVLYVFGGADGTQGSVLGDLYEYEIGVKRWRRVVYEAGPSARAFHA